MLYPRYECNCSCNSLQRDRSVTLKLLVTLRLSRFTLFGSSLHYVLFCEDLSLLVIQGISPDQLREVSREATHRILSFGPDCRVEMRRGPSLSSLRSKGPLGHITRRDVAQRFGPVLCDFGSVNSDRETRDSFETYETRSFINSLSKSALRSINDRQHRKA